MTVDDGFFEWGFKAIIAGVLAMGAYMWRNLVGDVRTIERNQARFELDVEKTFVRETTVSRLHDRLDGIETDIKTLIKSVAEK